MRGGTRKFSQVKFPGPYFQWRAGQVLVAICKLLASSCGRGPDRHLENE